MANRDVLLDAMVDFFDKVCEKLKGVFPRDDYILDLAIELQPNYNDQGIPSLIIVC